MSRKHAGWFVNPTVALMALGVPPLLRTPVAPARGQAPGGTKAHRRWKRRRAAGSGDRSAHAGTSRKKGKGAAR